MESLFGDVSQTFSWGFRRRSSSTLQWRRLKTRVLLHGCMLLSAGREDLEVLTFTNLQQLLQSEARGMDLGLIHCMPFVAMPAISEVFKQQQCETSFSWQWLFCHFQGRVAFCEMCLSVSRLQECSTQSYLSQTLLQTLPLLLDPMLLLLVGQA